MIPDADPRADPKGVVYSAPRQSPPPVLEVGIRTEDATVVCLAKGSLDATSVTTMRAAVDLCLGEPDLIIDLSGVHFLDGAGLTALVGAVRRGQQRGTRVAFVVSPGSIRKVLDEAGLDLIVNASDSVALALAKVRADDRPAEPRHSARKIDEFVASTRGLDG